MEIIEEGKAKFYASKDKNGKISRELEVFYNPVMKFNRDITINVLNAINQKDMQLCDLMAGSGVRSLRFVKELNKGIISRLVVNDHNKDFIDLFKKNLGLNSIDDKKSAIYIYSMDANKLLIESTGFDYIDIDPFGSPNDFLDASIRRISRKGILAVTATDTAPLAGTYPDACERNYWAKPLRNHLMHEMGLRILIRKIQLIGTQHDKALLPIYSYYKDHYFRIFFRCVKGKSGCDKIIEHHIYFLYCANCQRFWTSKYNHGFCCDKDMVCSGPLWGGALWDNAIIGKMDNNDRFMRTISEESEIDSVGFYDIHVLAKKHKFIIPNSDELLKDLNSKGKASRTIFSENGIKTDLKVNDILSSIRALEVTSHAKELS